MSIAEGRKARWRADSEAAVNGSGGGARGGMGERVRG